MNLSIELYHLPNNYANWHTLLLNRAFSAYYPQYRYRSPTSLYIWDQVEVFKIKYKCLRY